MIEAVRREARPLTGDPRDYDALLDLVGDARIVLLGEASHGTHEFYRERARITKRLIQERGFTAVAVEGDWPDAYRVNRFVRGAGRDAGAEEALRGFRRFPTWMWRNADVLDFVGWLRAHNDGLAGDGAPVGFYGLDLYSLGASIEAVIALPRRARPRRGRARAPPLRVPAALLAARAPSTAAPSCSGSSESCRRHVLRELVDAAPPRRPTTSAGTGRWPRTSTSSPSRTRWWSRTRRSTTARCSATRPRPGTCAIATWRTRSTS